MPVDLDQRHINALGQAEELMFHSDLCPYLELKELLDDSSQLGRKRFEILFVQYYNLGIGGLTEDFKRSFFKILFEGRTDMVAILDELSLIRRKKGDFAVPFSFVSKLVAIQQETSPLYDRHVIAFFAVKAPPATVEKSTRVKWFVQFLSQTANDYERGARDPQVRSILDRLKARDPRLACCHIVRLMDFLVWKVGNQRLLR